ncbi:probable LRR receptor-like serine/threonine-protein kinase At1g05700 [Aegilops tauschii subsp. strangulata]|uniref:non-specific serine/threonine protein kinase n=1 Tax=Aegilops tauschii TaxID=37682 RepID=N1R5U5_AEGTA|nr:probable LRR receptor-like serine/threonine-protein kinase At1g05700 [Triticum aestivum]
MDISWSADASMGVGVDTKYSLALYFAELEAVQGLRQFDVSVDNNQLVAAFSPTYLLANVIPAIVQGSGEHSISLLATSKSVLPPLINAMEIFMVWPLNESTTASLDANAMVAIQTKFKVKRNWVGDPCAPISFAWYGLDCSYTPDGPPRIIAINLSSSGLVGEIDASFGQLTLLQRLDLSHNNLSGTIPYFLGQVPSLTFLDLSSNDLNGPIPMNLLEKSQDGFLTLRIDNNPNLCGSPPCNTFPNKKKKPKSILQIVVPVIGALLLVALLALVVWSRRKKRPDVPRSANQFENWSFKSKELKIITNNFNTCVFWSCVFWLFGEWNSCCSEDAVRDIFTRDRKHLSLVYEYMDGGNLQDRLRGQESPNWLQRLKIALDSAYGLEYLHKSCSPPLIHRDVKTGNILLTSNLEAKLSDFGLTRAFSSGTRTHTTTQPAGTLGYLDPEYYATSHLSEKSDVYSFGVVLLVLITGQPAIIIISDTERTNISHWARHRLSEGDIDSVTDPTIRGDRDINSVWKVAELALRCTEHTGRDRPTMVEVVEGIKESLQLETSSRSRRCSSDGTGGLEFSDCETVGALETELIGETSAH